MTIRARIAHDMPGRLRVRLPDCRGNAQLFGELEDMLLQSRLFQTVRVNPVTASVVLEFGGPRDEVLDALRARLPFELELAPAPVAARIPAGASPTDPVRLVSGRDIDAMFLAGTLFGVIGLVQAARGKIMLPALTAFWYAGHAFRLSRAQKGDRAAATESAASG